MSVVFIVEFLNIHDFIDHRTGWVNVALKSLIWAGLQYRPADQLQNLSKQQVRRWRIHVRVAERLHECNNLEMNNPASRTWIYIVPEFMHHFFSFN